MYVCLKGIQIKWHLSFKNDSRKNKSGSGYFILMNDKDEEEYRAFEELL